MITKRHQEVIGEWLCALTWPWWQFHCSLHTSKLKFFHFKCAQSRACQPHLNKAVKAAFWTHFLTMELRVTDWDVFFGQPPHTNTEPEAESSGPFPELLRVSGEDISTLASIRRGQWGKMAEDPNVNMETHTCPFGREQSSMTVTCHFSNWKSLINTCIEKLNYLQDWNTAYHRWNIKWWHATEGQLLEGKPKRIKWLKI